MKEKLQNQQGGVPVGFAILLLVATVAGIAAGFKAVKTPTRTLPHAGLLKCQDLTQYSKRKCEITLPGPCTYGEWKYDCKGITCPYDPNAGVGVPYWCNGEKWTMMNYEGECTNECKPQSPQPTIPSGGQTGGGRCFYLTAEFNYVSQDRNFDVWVTFNTDDQNVDFHDIKLDRNGVHVAGYNKWTRPTPFTYWPEYTGGRIPPNTTVTFLGYDDSCGTRGNRTSVICTLNTDGTVNGAGCDYRFGQTETPTPTTPSSGGGIQPTNIPPITPISTNTPTPSPTTTIPTPTTPPDASCGYPGLPCCDYGEICYGGSKCSFGFCGSYPTPTSQPKPTATPTPTSTKEEPNFLRRNIEKAKEIFINPSPQIVEQKPAEVKGNVKVNNTSATPTESVFVSLHSENTGVLVRLELSPSGGNFEFDNLESDKKYVLKAWARDTSGNWYQNNKCNPLSESDYDCIVKPGERKELTISIGSQGIRYILNKSQETALKTFDLIRNIPIVGTFLEMFLISAF